MSKKSHAKHEHKVSHHHASPSAIEQAEPSFGVRHKRLIWAMIIFLVIFGSFFAAVVSLLR